MVRPVPNGHRYLPPFLPVVARRTLARLGNIVGSGDWAERLLPDIMRAFSEPSSSRNQGHRAMAARPRAAAPDTSCWRNSSRNRRLRRLELRADARDRSPCLIIETPRACGATLVGNRQPCPALSPVLGVTFESRPCVRVAALVAHRCRTRAKRSTGIARVKANLRPRRFRRARDRKYPVGQSRSHLSCLVDSNGRPPLLHQVCSGNDLPK